VPIVLTEFERGDPFTGNYAEALTALQDRLNHLQRAQISHGKRIMLIVEGWTASGKRDALRGLMAAWDPCQVNIRCPSRMPGNDGRHWLAPYWNGLPVSGETTVFLPSYYRRAIDRRIDSELNEREWIRAMDEINEFESQQHDHGTLILKLFLHVTADTQVARLRARQADPWTRPLVGADEVDRAERRETSLPLVNDMFAQTDTRWAPWRVVDANDSASRQIAFLQAIMAGLEKAIPKEPPAAGENVVTLRAHRQA
jgi:polyphosphate kinase 2 (PPK2 family)